MLILIENMLQKISVPGVHYVLEQLKMENVIVEKGYIELANNTDPEQIKQLKLQLADYDLKMLEPVSDNFVIKVSIAICNIFALSEAGSLKLPSGFREKFSLELYLPTVIGKKYPFIKREFHKYLDIPPSFLFYRRRWEYIMYWFSLNKSVEAVSVLALFQDADALTHYFKSQTGGISPTKYKFGEAIKYQCLKKCDMNSICSAFHSCPVCGTNNFAGNNTKL